MLNTGTALDLTPDNVNFLSPLVYKFQIKKTPNLNFYVQNVNLPGLHLQPVDQPNPLVKIPYGGDHLEYDEISINFKVDENMKNWLEIHNWIRAMGFPKSSTEHAALTAPSVPLGEGLTSDLNLIICDSQRNPQISVNFEHAFPISLASLIFDTTIVGEAYLTAAATFQYTKYEIEVLT